ncbi:MAG TPA: pilus assembly protein TadG-related protein [Vicinamibacterales bacterium]
MTRLHHLRDDERGASLLYITVGFLSFFAATTLAIDVGMLMTGRSQSQNAADAGALAGAIALALDDWDDRTPTGPAVQAAVNTALENQVIGDPVAVEESDVTFPVAPSGEANRVRVAVYRTQERNNPLSTFIAAVFGMDSADVSARATAHAAPANAMTCVRPFTIPDRWTEKNIPANDTFDRYDSKGEEIPNADEYVQGQNSYDMYGADKGTPLVLRAGTGNNIAPTFYYSWNMPGNESGVIGADWYEENIRACNQAVFTNGAEMIQEPGNMVGPTVAGVENLIAQDPTAYWDDDTNSVKSPLGRSPRIFPIPLYDPDFFQSGKMTGRNATLQMVGWIGFFVEGLNGNQVYGRITPILGTIDPDAGPAPEGSFPRAVQLVE